MALKSRSSATLEPLRDLKFKQIKKIKTMRKIKYCVVTGAKNIRNKEVVAEAFDFGVLPEGYAMPPKTPGVFDEVWQPRNMRDIFTGNAIDHIGTRPDEIYYFPHRIVSCLSSPTYVLGRTFTWGGDNYANSSESKVNYYNPVGLDCNFLPPSFRSGLLFLVDQKTFDANPTRMDLVIEGPELQTNIFPDGKAVEWLIGREEEQIPCLYGVWDVDQKRGRSDVAIKIKSI